MGTTTGVAVPRKQSRGDRIPSKQGVGHGVPGGNAKEMSGVEVGVAETSSRR